MLISKTLVNDFNASEILKAADCINFAMQNKLPITKDFEAGVNLNNGNTWIKQKQWSFLIIQPIGRDGPFFLLNCEKCGDEEQFNTLSEVKAQKEYFLKNQKCRNCYLSERA